VAASVQYRLRTKTVDVDDCLADCKSAIRYLRQHANELGVDPEKVAVVGESAGGHLAAAVATIDKFNHPEDDLSYSAVPNLLVLLNPITDLSTKWGDSLGEKAMALSPLQHVSQRTPPTLLIHGNVDQCVDIAHSRAFHERMIELDRPSKLIVFEGADHAFSVFKYGPDRFVQQAILEIDTFLVSRGWLTRQ
jgi:acetyl esterase